MTEFSRQSHLELLHKKHCIWEEENFFSCNFSTHFHLPSCILAPSLPAFLFQTNPLYHHPLCQQKKRRRNNDQSSEFMRYWRPNLDKNSCLDNLPVVLTHESHAKAQEKLSIGNFFSQQLTRNNFYDTPYDDKQSPVTLFHSLSCCKKNLPFFCVLPSFSRGI